MTGALEGPQKRRLGKTGVEVSTFGLGGEGVLRTWAREPEAVDLIWLTLWLGQRQPMVTTPKGCHARSDDSQDSVSASCLHSPRHPSLTTHKGGLR